MSAIKTKVFSDSGRANGALIAAAPAPLAQPKEGNSEEEKKQIIFLLTTTLISGSLYCACAIVCAGALRRVVLGF